VCELFSFLLGYDVPGRIPRITASNCERPEGCVAGSQPITLKVAMHTFRDSLHLVGRVLLAAGSIGMALAGDAGNKEPIRLSGETCASLKDFLIPASGIGLPSSGGLVQTAVFVGASDAGNSNGDFCKVTGIVKPHNPSSPNLEFEVNLPATWNHRALQIRRLAGNGSHCLFESNSERRYASQAGLRHARKRRRPQGQGRFRRQLRDGR
jgi:hypothetical protein